jgi:hypothetical protein
VAGIEELRQNPFLTLPLTGQGEELDDLIDWKLYGVVIFEPETGLNVV